MTIKPRMQRWLLALITLLLLTLAVIWIYARQTLPVLDGAHTVRGIGQTITIERDADGIPTIHARSREDALFGLGYVHAQDRLWQLDLHRRVASGRLAEAFGQAALETDQFLRALGVRRHAAAQWQAASPEVQTTVRAYTAGINAYIEQSLRARPVEFLILGLKPEPWQPEDVLAWSTMMAWDLGANWSSELLRMRLSLTMPVARINELLPPYPGEKPLPTADYAALFRGLNVDGRLGQQALAAAPESGIEGIGSNGWALSGARTPSGQPLLANDPHLRLSAPALWYLVRLDAPDLNVAGGTVPGLPAVIVGQNKHLAWGFTNTGPDVQDLYLERIHATDPTQYQTPTGWARFQVFDEIIKVKGGDDVHLVTRQTRHGPVISDAQGKPTQGLTGPAQKPTYALSLRWTALDQDAWTTVAAMTGMTQARTVADFIQHSAGYVAPMQTMVVADREGHIAQVSAGRVPLRQSEHDLKGLVPAPGWDARYDWAGYLAPELTPREIDPPPGWVIAANQRIHAPDYPHFITSEWTWPYRRQRIEDLLTATPRHSMQSLQRIQADLHSLGTQGLIPHLKKAAAASQHPLAAATRQALHDFDGQMNPDQAAPLITWAWARQLTEAVFSDEIGTDLYNQQLIGSRNFREALINVLDLHDDGWCDDQRTAAKENCDEQAVQALDRALDELQSTQGRDVGAWQWGRAHIARAEHRPFSRVALLRRFFEIRQPVGGDNYTVNQTRVSLKPESTTGERYLSEHGASFRAVYDLGDPTHSRFVNSTGQSGNVFSPWYRSLVPAWQQATGVPVFNTMAQHRLTLSPP